MRIDALSLDFFRNYLHFETEFHPEVNVICGDNAQGKTNLLGSATGSGMTGSSSSSGWTTPS